jgi:two-component system, cell cycle response regulator DivK
VKQISIIVVDDNQANLKLASDLLEIDGFTVYRCNDAESTIEIIRHHIPDLILMDVALPGMDGLELTRQLKSDPRTAGVKIVALTAFAMKSDSEKVFAAGCDGYITKPIDTRQFIKQLKPYL